MKINLLQGAFISLLAFPSFAGNDVYAVVDELNIRSHSSNNDHQIYFRAKSISDSSQYAPCIVDKASMVWRLDITSPVAKYQYELLLESYKHQRPVRLLGQSDVCAEQNIDSDVIFEISPWGWSELSNDEK
ncbi:hypothetical protein HG263_07415 [Pseudoalteromonas sp. JBTF-M23]|uniref:Uncharacterized protein n=1 Tax=Pseudoalteromonas caenipelagi TaxID=2726988 RepID=A0A849V9T4_9GAMM|nr:hypothetical protein [Pseudoalteromonas caenipelagi]NOU50369.1 hypothetical protein [Pseudoalteromonas caenipelagi]